MRPCIALAGFTVPMDGVEGNRAVIGPIAYVEALRRAGADEVILAPDVIDEAEARHRLERFDGLLLMGGADVSPSAYGEEPGPEVYGVDPERDAFEVAIVHAALALELPVLAVCRGIQVLNVALGGTLEQHIYDRRSEVEHRAPNDQDYGSHSVRLQAGSKVAEAMGTERPTVASWHHQAIARVAPDLTPVGWAEDGLIEAEEHSTGWVIGVQWHPEETAARDSAQQGLFDELVRQARKRAGHRSEAAAASGRG